MLLPVCPLKTGNAALFGPATGFRSNYLEKRNTMMEDWSV